MRGASIKFYRGALADIRPPLADGEPFWDTGTRTLYVGAGGTPVPAGRNVAVGLSGVVGGTEGYFLVVGPGGVLAQEAAPSGSPTGAAGGDLGGSYPAPEVLNVDGGTWE